MKKIKHGKSAMKNSKYDKEKDIFEISQIKEYQKQVNCTEI